MRTLHDDGHFGRQGEGRALIYLRHAGLPDLVSAVIHGAVGLVDVGFNGSGDLTFHFGDQMLFSHAC